MSSDYEYSDDDEGDYYDEDELMDQDDQGGSFATLPAVMQWLIIRQTLPHPRRRWKLMHSTFLSK